MAGSTRTGEIMDPWWKVLEAHRLHAWFHTKTSTIRGVRAHLTPVDVVAASAVVVQRGCNALRDALELMFLQSIVDYDAFMTSLIRQTRDPVELAAMQTLLQDEGAVPCHVDVEESFVWMEPDAELWRRSAISTILTPRRPHQRDQGFQDAQLRLLALARSGEVEKRLEISVGFNKGYCMTELAAFVQTTPPVEAQYPFGRVVIGFASTTVPKELLQGAITCLGDSHGRVRLGQVGIFAFDSTEKGSFGNLMAACFQPEGLTLLACESTKDIPRASIMTIICASHRLLTQLCSAVMSARGVESLCLCWQPGGNWPMLRRYLSSRNDQVRFMRWITLSLFSEMARHSINHLQLIEFAVDDTDMDDMEAFLLGTDPLRVLRRGLLHKRKVVDDSEEEIVAPVRSQILLRKGTQLWLNSFTDRSEATRGWETGTLERSCWADVVTTKGSDVKFYETLVPGYGWCKVRRSDAQDRRSTNQTQGVGQLSNHGITSLTLCWTTDRARENDNGYPGLRRFLHIVGAPLEALTLDGAIAFTPCLDTIWAACPLLRHLDLRRVGTDILLRIDEAYERGTCHLISLAVHYLFRPRGSQDLMEFCEKLSDPQRQLARMLTTFALTMDYHDHDEDETDQEVTSMVTMLACNVKLLKLSVNVLGSLRPECLDRLRAKHNESLPVQAAPLALGAKLAFLSAVETSSGRGAAASRPTLPGGIRSFGSDLLSRIFTMAAVRAKRKVLLPVGDE